MNKPCAVGNKVPENINSFTANLFAMCRHNSGSFLELGTFLWLSESGQLTGLTKKKTFIWKWTGKRSDKARTRKKKVHCHTYVLSFTRKKCIFFTQYLSKEIKNTTKA